jgi:hypothetical protein
MPVQEPISEKPKQIDQMEILNQEDRIFKSWATVEIKDREGDLLPISEFKKVMPIIMKRGGPLMDRHSNKQVGKILNYEFAQKETKEGPKEGLLLTNIVYKDYKLDDMVWDGVKNNIYKGLSFGGLNKKIDTKFEKGDLTKVLTDLEGFEFSLVPGMGNQEATMTEVNFLAKGTKDNPESIEEISKRLSIIEKTLNIKKEDLEKNDETPEDSNETDKECLADDKEINKSQTPNNETLLYSDKKSEKYLKETDYNKSMTIKKQDEMNETPEVQNPMEVIAQKLDQILQAVSTDKQSPELVKAEDKEEVEKQEDKPEDKKPEEDKKPKEEVEKEGPANGSKVTLPQSTEEKIEEKPIASDAEGDKVNFVEKEVNELKKQIDELPNQLMKQLTNHAASTPAPAINSINKSEGIKVPKTLNEVTKLMKEMGRK